MDTYHAINDIFAHLQDDVSQDIFLKRLGYSLSGRDGAIAEMVDQEIERHGSRDVMFCLLRWALKGDGEVVVFGAGFAGYQICTVLQRHGVRVEHIADNDDRLWGSSRLGIGIIPPAMIPQSSRVIIGVNSCVPEIQGQLHSLGIGDEHIFVPFKQWWLGGELQYFDPTIMVPGPNEVFVDGGSLDGKDSLGFVRWCDGDYKEIFAFEPDAENYKRSCKVAGKTPRMRVFEKGLWSDERMLPFLTGQMENCAISEDGDTAIQVTSIDRSLKGKEVTFIKMDIEGSEMEALIGSGDTIKRYKPKLAICVYHRPGDIVDIPQKILELCPGYRLYLRHYSYVDTETVLYAV